MWLIQPNISAQFGFFLIVFRGLKKWNEITHLKELFYFYFEIANYKLELNRRIILGLKTKKEKEKRTIT